MASGSKTVAWGIAVLAAVIACGAVFMSAREKKALEEELAEARAGQVEPVAPTPVGKPSMRPEAVPDTEPVTMEEETPAPETRAEPVEEEPEVDEEKEKRKAQHERIVDAQMTMMMNIAYGPLFEELGLDPGLREQALALMVELNRGVRQAAEKAMKTKDRKASELKAMEDEAEAELRDQLEAIFSPAELAAWDEYDEYADQIMFAQLLDGQLTMLSPGLDPNGREVVKEVFAEELALHLDAFGESDTLYTLDNFNQAQLDALLAGLERLEGSLGSDQYGHAAGFVKQVEDMFSAMAEQ